MTLRPNRRDFKWVVHASEELCGKGKLSLSLANKTTFDKLIVCYT